MFNPKLNPMADILLDAEAMAAPDWLSDEDCLHELGSDWCRRGIETVEDAQ